MFELHLTCKEGNFDVVYLRCIHCKRETGLFLKNNSFDEMITKLLDMIFFMLVWLLCYAFHNLTIQLSISSRSFPVCY